MVVAAPIVAAGIGAAGSILGGKKSSSGGGNPAQPASAAQIQAQTSQLPTVGVQPLSNFFPNTSLSAPGLQFSSINGDATLSRDSAALNLFDSRAPGFFQNIDDLRSRFQPGFSEVRDARLRASTTARQRGISNLRDSLARRRTQGSSFANAELVQAQREFGDQEAAQQAQSFLEEVAINSEIFKVELQGLNSLVSRADQDLRAFQIAAGLSANELNAAVAGQNADAQLQGANLNAVSGIIRSLNSLGVANGQLQQELDIANAQGFGSFFGDIAGSVAGTQGAQGTVSSGGFGGAPTAPQGTHVPFGGTSSAIASRAPINTGNIGRFS